MFSKLSIAVMLGAGFVGSNAYAGDVLRKLIAEGDPVAPAGAAYEQQAHGISASMYGGAVDFNVGGIVSTGPEIWAGNFTQKGPNDDTQTYRREDLYPGESQKLDAIRFRWMITAWEQPQSMRGWYVKAGYSYTRVNGKINRFIETAGQGSALPAIVPGSTPTNTTTIVTDVRHGVAAGFGNRWLFADQKVSVTLGASITGNFKRTVSVDGQDSNARADYDDMINNIPDTRMSTRPTPEANLGMGYAW